MKNANRTLPIMKGDDTMINTAPRKYETMREIRLWICQVIIPTVTTVGLIFAAKPELKDELVCKVRSKLCKKEKK